jgi:hypothetical protein
MPANDHLSELRNAIDNFVGDDPQPGTIEVDRPGKTDMFILRRDVFQQLINAAHRLNEIEGEPHDPDDSEKLLEALRGKGH